MTDTPTDPALDAAMLDGMEGLIDAMKGRKPSPAAADLGTDDTLLAAQGDHDALADAPWKEPGGLERGTVVGRHVVLGKVGAGAMGVVYAAYDPELDRKVAIKLLLPGASGGKGRTRLLREAQALAKLAHPNVVGIHDVGTVGEQVWLAMEFVQGQTLGAWFSQPRHWQSVLQIMRGAGEGLAAAHAAGLLHRDFKPENVMVSDDDRVRVMDFGLARARMNAVTLESEDAQILPTTATLAMPVTQAGAIVGTPRYMAPEQFGHADVTAAADQFAFCVTMWEALYGARPFGGTTLMEIIANVVGGRRRSPPPGRSVPGWLRRACERGLAVDPTQRWPSMQALLDTLATGRTRARMRKGLAALGVFATLGVGTEGYRRLDLVQRTAACEASGDEIASAWNSEREQALRAALVATGVGYASTTADKTMPWLDRRAEAWREARVETCKDASIRDRWDAELRDRSLWCLEERRMELQSLVDGLTQGGAAAVPRAVLAASGLASMAPCRDAGALEELAAPRAEERDEVWAARMELERASSLCRVGHCDEAIAIDRKALAQADAIDWRPLSAQARFSLGSHLASAGAYEEAESMLEQAYFGASEGVAPEVVVDAATQLVTVVGVRSVRPVEGLRWGRLAEVALAEIYDPEQLYRVYLLVNRAAIHQTTGEYGPAKAIYRQAIEIIEARVGPSNPILGTIYNNLAGLHFSLGEYDEAEASATQALAVLRPALGPDHPKVASSLDVLGALRAGAGDHDGAKALFEQVIAIRERTLGPDHPTVATALDNLAAIHMNAGNLDAAKPLYQRALEIDERLDPEHPSAADPLLGLAKVALGQGQASEAVRLAERAMSIRSRSDILAIDVAKARFVLAQALWDAPIDGGRDRARAITLAEQALDTFQAAEESDTYLAELERWLAEHTRE